MFLHTHTHTHRPVKSLHYKIHVGLHKIIGWKYNFIARYVNTKISRNYRRSQYFDLSSVELKKTQLLTCSNEGFPTF